jgi:crossover junction endodeoxyribonuclease RusA
VEEACCGHGAAAVAARVLGDCGTVHVTIFYFPASRMEGDVDNIVKPILDALDKIVYMSDRQVERVWVQKFEPGRPFSISNPTLCLAEALERERPVIYVRIDDDASLGERA